MTSIVDAESVLAVDIGSLNTRALLFDVVDGQYHLISAAAAPTTAGLPFRDVSEGVHIALTRLQEITGRVLASTEAQIILPSHSDGSGVDRLVITCSAGEDLRLVSMGLLGDVSQQSAQRLAGTTYGKLVETIGLNDRRRQDTQLDALVQSNADIIIIAGGTDKGATRSVYKLADLVLMACKVLPKDRRPKVLYCGNSSLAKRIKETLERETIVVVAPNIRPNIDTEDLTPAATVLAKITARLRTMQLGGLDSLAAVASTPVLPSSFALGRMMRFSSDLSDLDKPTLGIDLGANAVTLAVASTDNQQTSVFRGLGMGSSLASALQYMRPADIAQWIPFEITENEIGDYLHQKSLFPSMLPMTRESLAIEQAAARSMLRLAAQRLSDRYPAEEMSFERIFISGAALTQAAAPAQTLLMLLDGLQPVGINVLMLDPHGLSQALGAIAGINALLPSQILESGAYTNLGTVLCPLSDARAKSVIMRMKLTYEDQTSTRVEIKQGTLVPLPVRNGQVVHLEVETLHGTLLDPCLPRLRRFKIVGGVCGAVVDARGRPFSPPENRSKRLEQLTAWSKFMEERRQA